MPDKEHSHKRYMTRQSGRTSQNADLETVNDAVSSFKRPSRQSIFHRSDHFTKSANRFTNGSDDGKTKEFQRIQEEPSHDSLPAVKHRKKLSNTRKLTDDD